MAVATEPHSDEFHWEPFLKELSEFRLSDPRVAAAVPEQKVQDNWLGEPSASEQQIAALEGRLSRPLPPSYRSFLAASNGFQQQSPFIHRLYGADEADWFGSEQSMGRSLLGDVPKPCVVFCRLAMSEIALLYC